MTEDVATVAATVQALPSLCISGAIVLGCLVYMGVLSWPLLLVVAVTMVLGIAIFLLIKSKALGALQAARRCQDEIFAHFRGLTEGIKALKLHRSRRDAFFSEGLVASATACRDHSIVGEERYILAGNIANGLLFVIIGVIIFGMPAQVLLPSPIVTGFVLALVYLMTPFGRSGRHAAGA